MAYFLLWKYQYFDLKTNPAINRDQLENIDESQLREFVEKLKINNLIANTPSHRNLSSCNSKTFDNLYLQGKWNIDNDIFNEKIQLICEAANSCKNAKKLIQLVGLSETKPLSLSQSIARLCPLMLFQLQEKECVEQQESSLRAKNKPSSGAVWGFGLLFVTIVSFCSIAGVGILPFLSENIYETILTVLQGLAVGSLVGSALFHLIPQAFSLIIPGNYEYLWRALIIFGGIYLFFWSERLMKIVSEYRKKKKFKNSIPSTTSIENDADKSRQVYFRNSLDALDKTDLNAIVTKTNERAQQNLQGNGTKNENEIDRHYHHHNNDCEFINRERANSNFLALKHDHQHQHALPGESDGIATIAWMIIFGDGLHNFIDGITMGAAFSQSILEGISISVAVICEEFPHELGDFAILLGSGMSMRKALGYNFLSACTCYLGLVFGIILGDLSDFTPYIFALAGGMFLYISLVDMMGELSAQLEETSKKGVSETAKTLLLQNIGILIGVGIMFFLAKYGEKINFEGLVPPKSTDMPFTES
ncbi:Endothelin-converting enzyme 2 [Sarcoptes scabiei]|nr:Endothelin-converting enzyme 2 [Sarcoptes scabiei]